MRKDVVHGVDQAEVVGVQHVLQSRPGCRLLAYVFLEKAHDRVQHMDDPHIQPLASSLEIAAEGFVHHGGEHRPWFGLNSLEHAMQLEPGPDQAPAMIQDLNMLELGCGRPGDRIQRLAGRIGHQMKVNSI